ncbi:MAG: hypothetical protein PVG99_12510 [Desulfobacteraceae bacterium]|jgi:hypothetical protein
MSETSQIIIGVCALIAVYMLTRKVNAWRIQRAFVTIIRDLERQSAFDASSAVELSYAKVGLFRFGTRDFRPKALQYLVSSGVVGVADGDRYYLKNKDIGSRVLK